MAKIKKLQIKNRWTGSVLFEYEKENNTIKDTVIEAVKSGADIVGANLRGADLDGASLCGVNLHGAEFQYASLGGAILYGANLRGVELRYVYLCDANLRGADLRGADLGGAILRNVNLCGANLRGANLYGVNLDNANLHGADLCGVNLCGASLHGADLSSANLYDADIRDTNISDAKEIPHIPLACPADGAFVGWKKAEGKLIKLLIPEDAKRSSATSNKCRCSKARVLEITSLKGTHPVIELKHEAYNHITLYKVGEMVYPDSFDENRWNECSHGIHFFINKQDAINY